MKQILFILSILFCLSTYSQEFSIGIRGGMGSYSMDILNQFQQYRTLQMPLPLKVTENYPSRPYYRAELALNDISYIGKMAVFYGYYSTGARSTVSDYSGRADLDAVINGHQFGLTFQKEIVQKARWSFGAFGDASYLFSNLKTLDNLEITYPEESTDQQKYKFLSKGFALEPGLEISYHLNPLIFQINAGYLFDFSKEFHLKDNKDRMLGYNNQKVTPEWSGIRIGLQVSYVFKRCKESIE